MCVSVVGGVFCVTMSLCAFFNNFFLVWVCMTVCVCVRVALHMCMLIL